MKGVGLENVGKRRRMITLGSNTFSSLILDRMVLGNTRVTIASFDSSVTIRLGGMIFLLIVPVIAGLTAFFCIRKNINRS